MASILIEREGTFYVNVQDVFEWLREQGMEGKHFADKLADDLQKTTVEADV